VCWPLLQPLLDGPVLFEHKGLLFIAARHDVGDGRRRTGLWQVIEADQDVSPIADLPTSMGDTGSPGVTRLDDDTFLLTFHTTSALDPRVVALGHEPTENEALGGLAADLQAVRLDMRKIPAGR
jgi:hypothetical protein